MLRVYTNISHKPLGRGKGKRISIPVFYVPLTYGQLIKYRSLLNFSAQYAY